MAPGFKLQDSRASQLGPPTETMADLKEMIMNFLRRMDFTLPEHFCRDTELAERVKAVTMTWPFEDRVRKHIVTGVACAEACYPHLDIDARTAIAIYTSLTVIIDDKESFESLAGAEAFSQMLCDGTIHRDEGPLGQLVKVFTDFHSLFPPFHSSIIVASTLRFIGGEMITNPCHPSFQEAHSKAVVDYQRWMTGVAEPYVLFNWPKAARTALFNGLP